MKSLAQQRAAVIGQAREIAEAAKAAGRQVTPDELATINQMLDAVKSLDIRIGEAKAGEDLIARLGSLDGEDGHDPRQQSSETTQYLDLSPTGVKSFAEKMAKGMIGVADGRKALLPAGEVWGSIPTIPTDPVSLGKMPQGLISVLPVQQIPAGPAARYLRQTVRTLGAAHVPAGTPKPVTLLGLTPQDVALKVFATLSDPVDRFVVDDAQQVATWIATELTYAVLTAVEAAVINGTAPSIVGLLQTSGIKTSAFDTDLLTSTRKAVTLAETYGYATDLVWALTPQDWQAAELSVADSTFTFPGPPVDRAAKRLWGIPVTIVNGVPAGFAVLIDRPGVALYVDRQGIRVDAGSPRDLWERNEVEFRCEGRFDLGVLRPEGVIKVDTATP